MKPFRISALVRATFAALAILLAGCDDSPTTPSSLSGNWLAVQEHGLAAADMRVEDRLELTDDGRFVWTTVAFGSEGRSQDGMVAWFSISGDWKLLSDQLALRTVNGMSWEHSRGWSQLDYAGEWNRLYTLQVENERLVLTEVVPRMLPVVPRTYAFGRTSGAFDDGPRP